MVLYDVRREADRKLRAENEAAKAIRFAEGHGVWPLGLSPQASGVIARRPDSEDLQRRWGDLAESAIERG